MLECKGRLKTENSDFEAKQIVMSVLGYSLTDLFLNSAKPIKDNKKIRLCFDYVSKRNDFIPLYYILGECEFYSLKFKVGEGVLIPRQDTETLVELSLSLIKDIKSPTIVDLCSGSGCVAIALAKQRPDAILTAVELSDKACYYLNQNKLLNNADKVKIVKGDALCFKGNFDLVVCNPPYISLADKGLLNNEVFFEPENALFAPDNGLYFYKKIAESFANSNKPFKIAFEIGYNQADDVSNILALNGYENIKKYKDLNEKDRVVTAEHKKSE